MYLDKGDTEFWSLQISRHWARIAVKINIDHLIEFGLESGSSSFTDIIANLGEETFGESNQKRGLTKQTSSATVLTCLSDRARTRAPAS